MIVDCEGVNMWCECGDIAYCVSDSRLWCEKLVNTITIIKRGDVCLILAPQPNSAYATVLTKNLKILPRAWNMKHLWKVIDL
jgi:hypothetical protein